MKNFEKEKPPAKKENSENEPYIEQADNALEEQDTAGESSAEVFDNAVDQTLQKLADLKERVELILASIDELKKNIKEYDSLNYFYSTEPKSSYEAKNDFDEKFSLIKLEIIKIVLERKLRF